jgi:hypothetical protein
VYNLHYFEVPAGTTVEIFVVDFDRQSDYGYTGLMDVKFGLTRESSGYSIREVADNPSNAVPYFVTNGNYNDDYVVVRIEPYSSGNTGYYYLGTR